MADVVFPAFIKLQHKRDPSTEAAFVADVDAIVSRSERRLSQFSDQAQKLLMSAMAMPPGAGGGLNIDVSGLEKSAAAQERKAAVARKLAEATTTAAGAEARWTAEQREGIVAAQALAVAEERAAQSARNRASAAAEVQQVLNRETAMIGQTIAAHNKLAAANDNSARATKGHNMAMVGVGQRFRML